MGTAEKSTSKKNGLPASLKSNIYKVEYNETRVEENLDVSADAIGLPAEDDLVHWTNVDGLGDHTLISGIAERYGVHNLLLEDILNAKQRPKIDDYANATYIVAKLLSFDAVKKRITAQQLSLVLGKNYLLSFQEKPNTIFEPVRDRIRSGKGRIRKMKSDYLVYSLLDAVVDQYFIVIEGLREQIDYVQSRLLVKTEAQIPKMIHQIRLEVSSFRRAIWPLQSVLEQILKKESSFFDAKTNLYLRDVHDHVLRVLDQVDALHETLNSIIEAYLSLASQRLNEVMKVLTIFSTIFLPLTFVVGVYGMNFKHMPELEWQYGYPLTWAVMIGITVGLMVYFQRKKWL